MKSIQTLFFRPFHLLFLLLLTVILLLSGCSSASHQRIVRIGHNQSTNHPTHIALTAFQNYINEHLGDRYVVEVYPLITALPATPFWKLSVKTMKFSTFPTYLPVPKPIIMPWMIPLLLIQFSLPLRKPDSQLSHGWMPVRGIFIRCKNQLKVRLILRD